MINVIGNFIHLEFHPMSGRFVKFASASGENRRVGFGRSAPRVVAQSGVSQWDSKHDAAECL